VCGAPGSGQEYATPAQEASGWHWSIFVQALLSLQVLPVATAYEHTPFDGLHVPVDW
jgi:hypothetical protein